MRHGPSPWRMRAKVAIVIGVIALAIGVLHPTGGDADSSSQASSPDMTPFMDPGHGQSYALAFGDSYFTGSEHVTQAQTFGRMALNDLGYSVTIRGHGATGYVTGSHIDGWPNYVSQVSDTTLSNLPDEPIEVILLEGGINDAIVDVDPALVQINATWVMRALRDRYPLAAAVVLGVTPDVTGVLSGERLAITDAIERAAAAAGWRYLDTRDMITPRTVAQIIGTDRLHPTSAGHLEMAEALRQKLIKAGVPSVTTAATLAATVR